jgi:hypothetical protein
LHRYRILVADGEGGQRAENPETGTIREIIRRMSVNLQIDLLDQLLDDLAGCLTPDSARRIVELRASPEVQARVDEDFIAILQAKARRILSAQNAA